MPATLRQLLTAAKAVLALTLVLGIAYPLVMVGVGYLGLQSQAKGSLLTTSDGQVVGSGLIGQTFDGDQWFQPRPSAGDYDALASAGTNAGPNDGELVATIEQRRTEIAQRDGVAAAAVPADAVTASGSGLDPFISPAYALQQVPRVARARGLAIDQVRALVSEHTQGRSLGFLGQPRVNVVELNLALGQLS
jgi:K+-transporting ATPase ATPase C chain